MARYRWYEKRKSRKQLLKEIEELKALRNEYLDRWMDKCDSYNSVLKQIQTINAVCLSSNEEQDEDIKRCLCNELAKEIMQYVSFEKYKMADKPWYGEVKHVATIKIIE